MGKGCTYYLPWDERVPHWLNTRQCVDWDGDRCKRGIDCKKPWKEEGDGESGTAEGNQAGGHS